MGTTVSVAQLVEQLTLNQRVHGSSPCGDTENEAPVRLSRPGAFYLFNAITAGG